MSPFREPPGVELGPLAVGLRRAARRALFGVLPSGGRVLAPSPRGAALRCGWSAAGAAHMTGALGSLGVVLVAGCALIARAGGWSPRTPSGSAAVLALVIAGGLSLAAVLRALDAPRESLTLRGDRVGRAARRALRRVARLAAHAERAPERFVARRLVALHETLEMLADPTVAGWIPDDVRGRTELLLARSLAAGAGACWPRDNGLRAKIRVLLAAAAGHLAEPAPAEADLQVLNDLG
jgi:hypothetical protein